MTILDLKAALQTVVAIARRNARELQPDQLEAINAVEEEIIRLEHVEQIISADRERRR